MANGKLSYWVNNVNPTSTKIVLVALFQAVFIATVLGLLIADVLSQIFRCWHLLGMAECKVDFHKTTIDTMALFLAGLSGFTLGGRFVDRTTDYGYVERKNLAPAQPAPTIQTGDSPMNVNTTQTMPVPVPVKVVDPKAPAVAAAVAVDDPGLG